MSALTGLAGHMRCPSLLVCAVLVAACVAACKEPAARPAPAAASASAPRPASAARVTTPGDIATANVDAQIVGLERAAAAPNASLLHSLALVSLVGARGTFLGRVADLERADRLANGEVARAPGDPAALLARAGTRAALHRFSEALADLDAAAAAGANAAKIARQRASVQLGLGQIDATLAVLEQHARDAPGIDSLGMLAAVYGQLGRTDEARARFAAALHAYRDVSPFPLAWLELQEAKLWEREGRLAQARALYESAHARLPRYAHATAHLATLLAQQGERARAIALLSPLLESSDDPEIPGLLAPLLRVEGRVVEADAMLERARRGYDDLTSRHAPAYADHAARFWMGPGGDAGKALRLAEINLELRATEAAYQLAMEAALAAGALPRACAVADGALALPRAGPPVLAVAWRAYTACGRPSDAARVDALLR